MYTLKTGNEFEQNGCFSKQFKKFYHTHIEKPSGYNSLYDTKMKDEILSLMKELHSIEKVNLMIECMIDSDIKHALPLGIINLNQVQKGIDTLQLIDEIIQKNEITINELRDVSNKFYEFIPHSFGFKRPQIINSTEITKEKYNMLNKLITVALNITPVGFVYGEPKIKLNPFEFLYQQLNAELRFLSHTSTEFNFLNGIVKNTAIPRNATHDSYCNCEVVDIFEIERNDDIDKHLDHTRWLWHDTKLRNLVDIIKTGLKIAPDEAEFTGDVYGRGVYFADLLPKSVYYCDGANQYSYVFLCEVDLTDFRHYTAADHHNTNQSVFVNGSISAQSNLFNGIPIQSSNLSFKPPAAFNQFVIFDIEKIKIKYLLKILKK